jgi:hypothetical protein
VQLLLHRLAPGPACAGQPRHPCSDRDNQRNRNFLVRHFFHLAEQQDFSIRDSKFGDRQLNDLLAGAVDQDGFGSLALGGEGRVIVG